MGDLEPLAELTQLTQLDLSGTSVSDLGPLAGLHEPDRGCSFMRNARPMLVRILWSGRKRGLAIYTDWLSDSCTAICRRGVEGSQPLGAGAQPPSPFSHRYA